MKRNIIAIICLVFMFFSGGQIWADESKTLQKGDQVLAERSISTDQVEVFTGNGSKISRNIYKIENGNRILLSIDAVQIPKLGNKTKKAVSDTQLKKSLEIKLKANGLSLTRLPSKIDYSQSSYLPPVGTQNENSCVGWSVGYYLRTYQQSKDLGWIVGNNPSHIFSPTFIYNLINNGIDDGAYIEDAGKLLKDVGAATLADFPYNPGDYYTQPSAEVQSKSQVNKISDWRVLFSETDPANQIIQLTKEYLNIGDLPVVGIDVGLYFMYPIKKPDGNSFITTDYDPYGGHAVTVVGYDDNIITPEGTGAFKIINSWGTDWGSNGYSYITYPAFVNAVRAGYVFTDLINSTIDQLPVTIQNNVNFNISFSGIGLYNLAVKNSVGNPVYRSENLISPGGATEVQWSGKDLNGIPAPDGQYQLTLTTEQNEIEQSIYDGTFEKKARVTNATATIKRLNGVIQSVTVHLMPSTDGKVDINVKNGSVSTPILTNQPIIATQSVNYTISKELFDFNSIDLSKVSIVLVAQ